MPPIAPFRSKVAEILDVSPEVLKAPEIIKILEEYLEMWLEDGKDPVHISLCADYLSLIL